MRLEVMQRTMQAMADMDLAAAERMMEIAEKMAETHPAPLISGDTGDAKLHLYQLKNLVDAIFEASYSVSEMKKAPIAGAILQMRNEPSFSRLELN